MSDLAQGVILIVGVIAFMTVIDGKHPFLSLCFLGLCGWGAFVLYDNWDAAGGTVTGVLGLLLGVYVWVAPAIVIGFIITVLIYSFAGVAAKGGKG